MPHISNYRLNGERLQSVSTITNALAKEGLQFWFRKYGFKKCDKMSKDAREKGAEVAEALEAYRKTGSMPKKKFLKTVIGQWDAWMGEWAEGDLVAEPHLVNTVDKYHGSPDLVYRKDGEWRLGDDKCKKRFADYGLLMNEHAYAMCDQIDVDGVLTPVPWPVPLTTIMFWTYDPDSGMLYPHEHKFDDAVYQDFLECKRMSALNKKAEVYFKENAILLPEVAEAV
jgi:hypothetical protein